jgi:hypothetical protein
MTEPTIPALPVAFLGPNAPLAGPGFEEDQTQPAGFDLDASDSLLVEISIVNWLRHPPRDTTTGSPAPSVCIIAATSQTKPQTPVTPC